MIDIDKLLSIVWKAVVEHFKKHGKKYAVGGGAAAVGGAAYAVGESTGHKKGKKEGTIEQAKRDEKKINDMKQKHENDRKRWKEQEDAYENLLDEIDNQ